eukprot:6559718-Karenia_brevis.AAC.1
MELSRPLAIVPHVPRSLVLPLAASLKQLAHEVVQATERGEQGAMQDGWLAFLALPRVVLHCVPGR